MSLKIPKNSSGISNGVQSVIRTFHHLFTFPDLVSLDEALRVITKEWLRGYCASAWLLSKEREKDDEKLSRQYKALAGYMYSFSPFIGGEASGMCGVSDLSKLSDLHDFVMKYSIESEDTGIIDIILDLGYSLEKALTEACQQGNGWCILHISGKEKMTDHIIKQASIKLIYHDMHLVNLFKIFYSNHDLSFLNLLWDFLYGISNEIMSLLSLSTPIGTEEEQNVALNELDYDGKLVGMKERLDTVEEMFTSKDTGTMKKFMKCREAFEFIACRL